MPGLRIPFGVTAALALIALPGLATAQSSSDAVHTYTVTVMGGLGGSIDEDRAGYDNSALQLGFSVVREPSVEVSARLGTLGFGSAEALGTLLDVDLSYATVAGQYNFGELGYQSGIFFGLGVYRLEGTRLSSGQAVSTSTIGVTAGATGEFDVSERIGVVGELSAHLLPSAETQVFVSGLVGLSIHFK